MSRPFPLFLVIATASATSFAQNVMLGVRAAIADLLWERLDQSSPDESAETWSQEIKRRMEDIDSGNVELIPYEEVRRRLMARLSDTGK